MRRLIIVKDYVVNIQLGTYEFTTGGIFFTGDMQESRIFIAESVIKSR